MPLYVGWAVRTFVSKKRRILLCTVSDTFLLYSRITIRQNHIHFYYKKYGTEQHSLSSCLTSLTCSWWY